MPTAHVLFRRKAAIRTRRPATPSPGQVPLGQRLLGRMGLLLPGILLSGLLLACTPHTTPAPHATHGPTSGPTSGASQPEPARKLAEALRLLKDENAFDPPRALDLLEPLAASGEPLPTTQAAQVLRLMALRLLGRNAEAVAQANALLLAPRAEGGLPSERAAEVFTERGRALADLERFDRAREDFDQALRLNPKNVGAYLARGDLRFALGDAQAAEADYSQAIALAPEEPLPWVNRGVARDELDRPAEAVEDFTMALRLAPGMATAYANRGISLSRLGDFAGMCRDYAAACARGDCTRWNEAKNLGYCQP